MWPTQVPKALLYLTLLAFALRLWGVAGDNTYDNDEHFLVPAVYNYMDTGNFEPDSWEHPPLKYYLLLGSMKVFGNNGYGWRMKNVIMGSLTVMVLYLIGSALFIDRRVPILAALMLTMDPLHLFFSRLIHGEISSTLFFLLALYITILYLQDRTKSPILAGIFAGLAVANKWYYLLPLLALGTFTALYRRHKKGLNVWEAIQLGLIYSVLPFTVYLLPFFPWFQRGYSFSEFLTMQIDIYHYLQGETIKLAFLNSTPSEPLEWFVKPLIAVMQLAGNAMRVKYVVFMNNPPIWLLTFPALVFIAYRIRRNRDWLPAIVPFLFLATYLQFALVHRDIFLYSALVVLPYAFLCIAYLLVALLDRFGGRPWHERMLQLGIIAWGLYLYPFVTNRFVPEFLYAPLIALGTVVVP